MDGFSMNGFRWAVVQVEPGSRELVDRTGRGCLATTDPSTMCVYLDSRLRGDMLQRVLVHEIGHCAIWSYDLFGDIRRFVRPSKQVEAEEWVCNFVADYGEAIFAAARKVLGQRAIAYMPSAFERLVS